MSYSRAWHTLRTRPLNWTTYQKEEDVVIAFFSIHDLSGKGGRGKESEYFHHNSTPAFQNKYGFQKKCLKFWKWIYKKNQLLLQDTRLHKVYSRYIEVINYKVISASQKDLYKTFVNK